MWLNYDMNEGFGQRIYLIYKRQFCGKSLLGDEEFIFSYLNMDLFRKSLLKEEEFKMMSGASESFTLYPLTCPVLKYNQS